MMHIFQYISLAIVQGVTEFLPISSSGHLAILQKIFGFYQYTIGLDAVLHLGTLLAVLLIFWPDIAGFFKRRDWKLFWLLVIGSIPAAIFGLIFKNTIENSFGSIKFIALAFIFTAIILIITRFIKQSKRAISDLKWLDAIFIGIAQMLALFPGISRSGMTISAGLFKNLKPLESYRFSFLLSIPAILGALILESRDIFSGLAQNWAYWLIALAVSFAVGIFSLKILSRILEKGKFFYFAIYLLILAGLILSLTILV